MTSAVVTCFGFEDHLVRVIMRGEDPWFVANDVCRVLGIKQATRAVEPLDDEEKGVSSTHTLGGEQEVLIVSESGLYTLILRCRSATTPGSPAHRFRRWVTGEVLPQIRKTGQYAPPEAEERAACSIAEERLKLDKIHYVLRGFGPAAMRALWKALGLDWVPEMDHPDTSIAGAGIAVGADAEPDARSNYELAIAFIAERGAVSEKDLKRKFKNISEAELLALFKAIENSWQKIKVTRKRMPSGNRTVIIYEYIGDHAVYSIIEPNPNDLN